MKSFFWVAIDLIGFFILIFMYHNTDKTCDKKSFGQKLFRYLMIMVMLYLIFDTGLYLISGADFPMARIFHYLFCILYYLVDPMVCFLYFLYCDYKVFNDRKGFKRRFKFYMIPAAISAFAVILSPLTGWIFFIDENNFYNRGDYLWITLIVAFGYVLASYPLLAVKTGKKPALAPRGPDAYLYLFPIPPLVLAVVQLLLSGPLLLGMGFVVAVFFMYNNVIQSSEDKRRLSVRFRNTYIAQFAVVSFIMAVGMLWTLDYITNKVAQDYAVYRAANTAGVLSTYFNKDIGILRSAANSRAVIEWFGDENSTRRTYVAYEEFHSTLRALYNNNLYIVVGKSGQEYTLENESEFSDFKPHGKIFRESFVDKWAFDLMASDLDYGLLVDIDKDRHRRRVWLNFKVTKDNSTVGIISTGMELSQVVREALSQYDNTKTRTLVINENGVICMDSELLDGENFLQVGITKTIDNVIVHPDFLAAIQTHLKDIDGHFRELNTESEVVDLQRGRYRYATIAPIGATSWSVVTLFDSSSLINISMFFLPFAVILVFFILFAFSSNRITQHLIFTPLNLLVDSLIRLKENNEQHIYGMDRADEIGILSNTIQDLFVKGHYDGLTGIFNRRYLEMSLGQIMAALSRSDSKLSVIMADVDFFKKYNDTYGHNSGDECLKAVAKAMDGVLMRSGDFVARYGGEEFAVVLPGTDETGIRNVADKLLDAVRDLKIPHEKNEGGIVTISLGTVTAHPKRKQSWHDYIKKADEALYMSKNNGRNQCTSLYIS